MSDYSQIVMPPADPALSRMAAIVGLGETDYHEDYKAERARAPSYRPWSQEELAKTAFDRALTDSGLNATDIDGLALSFTYGGPSEAEMAELLGLKPRLLKQNGNIMAGPLPVICADIASGEADTVAMIYMVSSRSIKRQYGGSTYVGGQGGPSSYYYYHPWGWSSQAAHWAVIFRYYQSVFGVREEDLGAIAMLVRRHAMANPNAIMQAPMSVEDYMASRYIVRPMHLFDMCLVNDGAVCLIVRKADMARDLPHKPVLVAGWGEAAIRHRKMECMIRDRLRPLMQRAGAEAFAMAGLSLADVQHFEGYDSSTVHLLNQIEGYGFAEEGTGLDFCKAGEMELDGRVPTNTGGGNLSGSYMHGWSQVAEVVRQLRHEAHGRQIPGVQVSMSSLAQTDQMHPILYVRGE
jgi:acetyl-CoA acetyltransferase